MEITKEYVSYIQDQSSLDIPPFSYVVSIVIGYLIMIYMFEYHVLDRTRKPVRLINDNAVILYNISVTVLSLVMFVCLSNSVMRVFFRDGIYGLICASTSDTLNLNIYFWCNIFHYSKYYELTDTLILFLRGKYTSFLQIYHHTNIIFLTWLGLYYGHFFGWVLVFLNSGIHSVMYYYYTCATLNKKVWWKKYLTQMQMVQFVADGIISLPGGYFYTFGHDYCPGNIFVWLYGYTFGVSLIYLFLQYYKASY